MRISDWSSDVCSSDLIRNGDMIAIYDNQTADAGAGQNWYRRRACAASADECDGSTGEALISFQSERTRHPRHAFRWLRWWGWPLAARPCDDLGHRSEEHTSELQSLMRISYAVFC